MRIAVATFFLFTLGLSAATAQTTSCAIPTTDDAANACLCVYAPDQPLAVLDQPEGNIRKSEQNGYVAIAQPTNLTLGDLVLFASNGSGVLKVANCEKPVGPNATLIIRPLENGCTCAQLVTRRGLIAAGGIGAPEGIFGGIAALLALKVAKQPFSP